MKRYTYFPQIVLGIAFAWSILMIFMAIKETIPLEAWLLFFAVIIWTFVYDTIYAIMDKDDDVKIGVKSTALFFGYWNKIVIGILQVVMISLLFLIGQLAQFNNFYWLGLLIGSILLVYQQQLINKYDPTSCFKAFLNNNYFGMVIFLGIFLDYIVP